MENSSSAAQTRPPARLALASGMVFDGYAFGALKPAHPTPAEVVFNTASTGYQESLSDPSYRGQILVQTTPMIGNTGATPEDLESGGVQVAGFVIHELTETYSNYRAEESLDALLTRADVPGIAGIDTRALTAHLRSAGSTPGVISADASLSDAALVEIAKGFGSMAGRDFVADLEPTVDAWKRGSGDWRDADAGLGAGLRVLAFDFGIKQNILRHLVDRGCDIELARGDVSAADILSRIQDGSLHGVFVSNGPGDPAAIDSVVDVLAELLGANPTPPIFGICLGHQLLARALGATTYKLPFGHRGANQPVHSSMTGRVEITSQNHGFAVDTQSLRDVGGEPTHVHLNDGTLAGFRLSDRPVLAVQYHPEASPGPHDGVGLFDVFIEMMRTGRPAVAAQPERFQ